MNKELSHYHPDGIAIINAYVDGVNCRIEQVINNPSLLPEEFRLLGIVPGKWTPEIVVSRHQGLLSNVEEELKVGRAVAIAGEEKVKELYWFHPKQPDIRLDPFITRDMLSADILSLYTAFRKPLRFERTVTGLALNDHYTPPTLPETEGSNNWVVAGRKTASGFPILANDPHRAISVPSLRYMVHLVAPGWNVIGAGEPTIPGISIGHNEKGAWGLTIFETDAEDLYVYELNPDNLMQYRYQGQWKKMESIVERIPVKGQDSVTQTFYYTVHGPVCFIDSARKRGYAVRCGWLEPGGAPYLASLRMDQATDWNTFREACTFSHIPGENMVWADKKGTIGWQVVGIAPVRNTHSGMVPVPGDGRFEWSGYLPMLQRPSVANPEKGFWSTANQHLTPQNYTHWNSIGFKWADPYRGNRINEVLLASSSLTVSKTQALQTDYYSIPARTLVPLLKEITFEEAPAREAAQLLLRWNDQLTPSSIEASIYTLWERKIMSDAAARFIPKELNGLVHLQLHKVLEWITDPVSRFEGDAYQNRNRFLKNAFTAALVTLNEKLGPDQSHWQYGQPALKHSLIKHPLDELLPAEQKTHYTVGPLARGGNSHTVNSTSDSDRQTTGASFRIVTDLSDWDNTFMINTPGQSGDPYNPYYRNLFNRWATDHYFQSYFSKNKIESTAATILNFRPE
jgi:penicillin amidase